MPYTDKCNRIWYTVRIKNFEVYVAMPMMKQQDFFKEEGILSPEKEAEIKAAFETAMKKNVELEAENADLKNENAELKQQLAWLKKQVYGQKTEKTEVVLEEEAEQTCLFDEAETEAETTLKEETIAVKGHTRKAKRTHAEIMKDLPVEEVVHKSEERNCDKCGSSMEVIGKEFCRDEVVYIPAKMILRKHYIEVLKCPNCASDESLDETLPDVPSQVIRKAQTPKPFIPHSFCSPELLAHIVFEKYVQGVPLYRQEKEYAALGISLSRTTMANWIIRIAASKVLPVWELMKSELLKNWVIHADETVVQVLHEKDRKAKTKSRMWVYCAPNTAGHANILFEYAPTRGGENAVRFLGDYDGYLVCDGYDAYNRLQSAIRCGCFAHVRRKFVDALPTDKKLLPTSAAVNGIEYCNQLFALEEKFKNLSCEERLVMRKEHSKPILDNFFAWLENLPVTGKTKLAKAVQYARNEKKYLCRFLDDGNVPISNNQAENAIRPFVVGRKNWLFSDSVQGAKASAIIYSLAATACANGLNVEEYFTNLFYSLEPILPW